MHVGLCRLFKYCNTLGYGVSCISLDYFCGSSGFNGYAYEVSGFAFRGA